MFQCLTRNLVYFISNIRGLLRNNRFREINSYYVRYFLHDVLWIYQYVHSEWSSLNLRFKKYFGRVGINLIFMKIISLFEKLENRLLIVNTCHMYIPTTTIQVRSIVGVEIISSKALYVVFPRIYELI